MLLSVSYVILFVFVVLSCDAKQLKVKFQCEKKSKVFYSMYDPVCMERWWVAFLYNNLDNTVKQIPTKPEKAKVPSFDTVRSIMKELYAIVQPAKKFQLSCFRRDRTKPLCLRFWHRVIESYSPYMAIPDNVQRAITYGFQCDPSRPEEYFNQYSATCMSFWWNNWVTSRQSTQKFLLYANAVDRKPSTGFKVTFDTVLAVLKKLTDILGSQRNKLNCFDKDMKNDLCVFAWYKIASASAITKFEKVAIPEAVQNILKQYHQCGQCEKQKNIKRPSHSSRQELERLSSEEFIHSPAAWQYYLDQQQQCGSDCPSSERLNGYLVDLVQSKEASATEAYNHLNATDQPAEINNQWFHSVVDHSSYEEIEAQAAPFQHFKNAYNEYKELCSKLPHGIIDQCRVFPDINLDAWEIARTIATMQQTAAYLNAKKQFVQESFAILEPKVEAGESNPQKPSPNTEARVKAMMAELLEWKRVLYTIQSACQTEIQHISQLDGYIECQELCQFDECAHWDTLETEFNDASTKANAYSKALLLTTWDILKWIVFG